MTTEQQNLNLEQRGLVAVGASVGAGCHPCLTHHLNAGAQAGLSGDQLLAAVASAERVSAEAAVAIGDHGRAELGAEVSSPALLSRLEEALASFGAALGANDKTNIARQLRSASELGASRSQLQQAIETAHNVQENAARIHRREAEQLLDTIASASATATDVGSGARCGCDAAEEIKETRLAAEEPEAATASGEPSDHGCGGRGDERSEQAPEPSEEPELVAANGSHAGGCGPMAAGFAAAGSSGAMAGCREMFGRFMPAATAETEKAPTATSAAGPCKKEEV